jgi:hypothetical protein
MIALLVIVALGVAAILWGRFIINPQPEVFLFDAGPAEQFQVGDPVWFPEARIFVIAVDDDGERKMIRALDAIARGTGCTIELHPQLIAHLEVDRVQPLRAVEREPDDIALALGEDEGAAHGAAPADRFARSAIAPPPLLRPSLA